MSARVIRIYDRKSLALAHDNTLQSAFKSALLTAQVLTWLFLFAQSAKYIFLATLVVAPKLFDLWTSLKEFFS